MIQNEYYNHVRLFHQAVWNIALRHFDSNEETLTEKVRAEIADIKHKEQEK